MPGNGSIELYNVERKPVYSQKIMLTNEEGKFKIEKLLQKGS